MPALAQRDVDIRFEAGSSGAAITGTITGNDQGGYSPRARGGQVLSADMAVTGTDGNGTVCFNILPGGADCPALYVGRQEAASRSARVTLPEDGVWTIRTCLMGKDADTGKTVGRSIAVEIDLRTRRPGPGGRAFPRVPPGRPPHRALRRRKTVHRPVRAADRGSVRLTRGANPPWCGR